jgi:DNA-binding NarL/FixJ family response regulator
MMTTILIVDDDKTLQLALTRRLQASGYDVINAASGQEALDLWGNSAVDVVVSDILMPGMGGLEFCHQLRTQPGGQLVPFIFLSSLGEVGDRIHGYEFGGDDYLVKPFHARELLAKIQGALARLQRMQAAVDTLAQQQSQAESPPPEPLPLTPSEEKVFWEVVQGFTNKQIAEHLFISPRTVQTHLSNMLAKLNLTNRSQLVRFAFENGYHPPTATKP